MTKENAKNPEAVFLLCYIIMLGSWFVNHGFITVDHYNLNSHIVGSYRADKSIPSIGQDFAYIWNSSKNVFHPDGRLYKGHQVLNFTGNDDTAYSFTNPPLGALFLKYVTYFKENAAYRVYLVSLLCMWVLAILLLGRYFNFNLTHYSLAFAIVLLSGPFHFEFERGNWHTPVITATIAAFYVYRKHNDAVTAGFLLAFASLFKMYPLLFIVYFAAKRCYKVSIYAGLFLLAIIAMTGGFDLYLNQYIPMIQFMVNHDYTGYPNHSLLSALTMVFKKTLDYDSIKKVTSILNMVLAGSALLYLALMNVKNNPKLYALEFAIVMNLATIIHSVSFYYTLVFMPFAVFALIDAFDHPLMREKLGKRWLPVLICISFFSVYILMGPIAAGTNRFNFISRAFKWEGVKYLRQLFFPLVIQLAFFISIHFTIAWYEKLYFRFSLVKSEWRHYLFPEYYANAFKTNSQKLLNKILLNIDGARYTRVKGLVFRGFAYCLFAYLMLNSIYATY